MHMSKSAFANIHVYLYNVCILHIPNMCIYNIHTYAFMGNCYKNGTA